MIAALASPPVSPVVAVTAVGRAEGARGVAAALACLGADVDRATLLVEVGGRPPRPALLASAAAQALEERLAAHLPAARVAARGQVCHLAVAVDRDGLETAAAAIAVARGALAVLLLPPSQLPRLLGEGTGPRLSGVLLRADIRADRALLALAVRDLLGRGLAVGVAKQRLGWLVERRALFGALVPGSSLGAPARQLLRLASHRCYITPSGQRADSTRAAQPERRDHARAGSR